MNSTKPALKLTTLVFVLLLLIAVLATGSARAQTYTVLHKFRGLPDGALPEGSLIADSAGNLYGTTLNGGSSSNCPNGSGCGTVFKVNAAGRERVLHGFTGGTDGGFPYGGLIRDSAGNLYGAASLGGDIFCNDSFIGCGAVFKMNPSGAETVLYTFEGGTDGSAPNSGLARDSSGNLYGTTSFGGDLTCNSGSGCGTVFMLDTNGTKSVLYSFTGGADGEFPLGGLIRDPSGNLYGTTQFGGVNCCGVVFKIDPTGAERVLYSFSSGTDGGYPAAGLLRDAAGNLYGTTQYGGDLSCNLPSGCGTVFKVSANGGEKVLYSFAGLDGESPNAGLLRDPAGNFYGTTLWGGHLVCNSGRGCGTVFKLDTNGVETVLHKFTGGADGGFPVASLVRDSAGTLYGTANEGGDPTCNCGTVFKLVP